MENQILKMYNDQIVRALGSDIVAYRDGESYIFESNGRYVGLSAKNETDTAILEGLLSLYNDL